MRLQIKEGIKTGIEKPSMAVSLRHAGLELILPIIQKQIAALQAHEQRIKEILNG